LNVEPAPYLVTKDQRLVQGERADAVLKQQRLLLARESSHVFGHGARPKERLNILHSVLGKRFESRSRDGAGMREQCVRVGRPVDFGLGRETSKGLASSPTLAIPCFLHSTRVVPVPQNGSSTVSCDVKPKRSIYSRTRCGGNDNTNRYQSWHWRSSSSILLAVALAVACSGKGLRTVPSHLGST